MRRIVSADPGCLFNAMGYNMERNRFKAHDLRREVADLVSEYHPVFKEGALGQSCLLYTAHVMDAEQWGGPIELRLLAECASTFLCRT